MHLSFLSDGSFSDAIDDTVWDAAESPRPDASADHLRGVVRGLLFLLGLGIPLVMAVVLPRLQSGDLDAGIASSPYALAIPIAERP